MKLPRCLLIALLTGGCSSPVAPDPSAFGARYQIQAAPTPPRLSGSALSVTVEYGGCGGNHEFELRHRSTSANHADLWLRKVTPDQPCDMLVIERLIVMLPAQVSTTPALRLLGPGEVEFELRP